MLRNLRSLSFAFLAVLLLYPEVLQAQRTICATPEPDLATTRWIEEMIRSVPDRQLADKVRIPVVFHNIYAGKKGKVADQNIRALINTLNEDFAGTPFELFLARVNRVNNKGWFSSCLDVRAEKRLKRQLADTPQKNLNIYSCSMGNVLGYAYLPFMWPEKSFMHGWSWTTWVSRALAIRISA